jgi:hypothetical protein
MKANDATGNDQNCAKRHAHGATFAKVVDGRKQPIRGLWLRGTRYYARLNVANPLTGIKKTCAGLGHAGRPSGSDTGVELGGGAAGIVSQFLDQVFVTLTQFILGKLARRVPACCNAQSCRATGCQTAGPYSSIEHRQKCRRVFPVVVSMARMPGRTDRRQPPVKRSRVRNAEQLRHAE